VFRLRRARQPNRHPCMHSSWPKGAWLAGASLTGLGSEPNTPYISNFLSIWLCSWPRVWAMGTAGAPTNLTIDPFHRILHLLSQKSALTSTVKSLWFYITIGTTLFFSLLTIDYWVRGYILEIRLYGNYSSYVHWSSKIFLLLYNVEILKHNNIYHTWTLPITLVVGHRKSSSSLISTFN
jgi:hypothetical protein